MFKPKTVESYVDTLSKKYELPKELVRKILMFGMKNITNMIKDGEDIRIPKFGNIYFDKKIFSNYLKNNKNEQKLIIGRRGRQTGSLKFSKSTRKLRSGGT